MAQRKGMTNLLSKVPPPTPSPDPAPTELAVAPATSKNKKLFDRLNAVSPFDAEPELARIARKVSMFAKTVAQPAEPPVSPEEKKGEREHGQTKWSDHVVRPHGLTKRSDQMVYPVRPHGQTTWSDQMVRPEQQENTKNAAKPLAKTRQQKALLGYLAANPNITTSVSNLSEILAIPTPTLRKNLTLFERAGKIRKSRIGNDGLKIIFINEQWSDHVVRPHGQTTWSNQKPSKIDREKTLSISLENMNLIWPHLTQAGFGPEQIAQIQDSLAALGKSTDRLPRGLDHAEWELAKGAMLDKTGQPVADPCSWVFRALARTGYYRRPADYVSPEEQAARDAEVEARALLEARQKAENARFEAWRDTLDAPALAQAMAGYPGGPRDAWLRRYWKQQQEKEGGASGGPGGASPLPTPPGGLSPRTPVIK